MSAEERSNWRDERISKKHREWGPMLPAEDIDGLIMLEENWTESAALIEYKHERAKINMNSHQSQALANLADRATLPFFVTKYSDDLGTFTIIPGNALARQIIHRSIEINEMEYVQFLKHIRRIRDQEPEEFVIYD